MHFLPVATTFRGTTDIAENFIASPVAAAAPRDTNAAPLLTANFRGRRLLGQKLSVPRGYECQVVLVTMRDTRDDMRSRVGVPKSGSGAPSVGLKRERIAESGQVDDASPRGGATPMTPPTVSAPRTSAADIGAPDSSTICWKGPIHTITLWEHDRPPGAQGVSAFTLWPSIATVMHRPIKK